MALQFLCNLAKWKRSDEDTNPSPICPKNPYRIYELEQIRNGFRDSIDPMIQAQMGICGTPKYLNGLGATSDAGVYYCRIDFIEDTVLNITAGNTAEQDGTGGAVDVSSLSTKVFKAGSFLMGNFSKVVLASGFCKVQPHPFLP